MYPQGYMYPGANEVRWRPGQEASLAPACSKQVFRKQMYCTEESICDIVGTFWRPCSHLAPHAVIWRLHSDSAPEELRPLDHPSLRPCMYARLGTSGLDRFKHHAKMRHLANTASKRSKQ